MPRDFLAIRPGNKGVALDALFSDTVDLAVDGQPIQTKAVYVGAGGDIAFVPSGQTTAVTYVAAQTGSKIVMSAKRILSTGTTATSLVADYDEFRE